MKKKIVAGSAAAVVLLSVSFCAYELGKYQASQAQESNIAYVETSKKKSTSRQSENKTPDQISQEEGISAEQIVVKITDDGYVTSHGDHYHYYNGKVPYDALISEELVMKDPNYVFKQEDVINEVKDGYIIKVDGNYYLYLKENSDHKNIRTKEQIAAEREKGTKEAAQKQSGSHKHGSQKKANASTSESKSGSHTDGRYKTDDGYVFSPTDVINDLGDGFLVPHGNHFHFIPKADLSPSELAAAQAYWDSKQHKGTKGETVVAHHSGGVSHGDRTIRTAPVVSYPTASTGQSFPSIIPSPSQPTTSNKEQTGVQKGIVSVLPSHPTTEKTDELATLLYKLYHSPQSERYTEADGLVFDPAQITKRTGEGVVVPHGDHFHFIPYDRMSELEATLAKQFPIGTAIQPKMEENKPTTDPIVKPVEKPKEIVLNYNGTKIVAYGKGLDGKPYDTSDGYVFSKASILSVDNNGLTASHGDHIHYIGLGELEQGELDQVAAWVKEKAEEKKTSQPKQETPKSDTKSDAKTSQSDEVKPAFDYKKVSKKLTQNGQTGYLMKDNGKEYFYAREELDLTKISFAEQELMSAADGKYIYDIVAPKENELAPKLYVTASQLKMHAGNATYDTGESFIIPHIDHIHVVPYTWLTAEEIASVKYIMQHPEDRPAIWTEGHGSKKEIGTIVNVTPESERSKLKNWQIIHSADEVRQALKEGKFADSDGYIFAPEDVLDPGTFVWKEAFSIPRATGGSLRAISKKELSEQEWAAAQELLAKAKADKEKAAQGESTKATQSTTQSTDKKGVTKYSTKTETATNVTPESERSKLKNWQIIHSAEEVKAAKAAGKFADSDGYIFAPEDVLDPGTFVWKEAFSIPRATGGSLRAISKKELSEQEWTAAQELLAKAKADKEKDKDKKEEPSKDQKSQSSESKKDDNLTEGQGTVYSASEIAAAKKAGRYVSYEDGYIFNASDIISDEGDQYIVVYKDYVHWVDKTLLSKSEEASAQAFCKEKGLAAPAKDDKSYFTPDKESAEEVYDRVIPQKIIPIEKMPYNTAYVTMVKNGNLVIPHKNHYHNIAISWFDDSEAFKAPSGYSLEELFATIKYYLEHPEDRPSSQYGWGSKTVQNTPNKDVKSDQLGSDERKGKPNSQITYNADEIAKAKASGKYTTSDGYIFDAKDIVSDEGDAYIVPHMSHSHWIPKSDLSEEERQAAQAFCAEKGITAGTESKTPEKKAQDTASSSASPKLETAAELYERVSPEKVVPVDVMPYNTAYAVAYQNGRLVIPHQDHYHNVALSWFDDKTIKVPSGYSLEQLLATIKYFVEHPEDRPTSDDGWGNASDHVKGEASGETASEDQSETSD
ncbi:MAG: pneumococcal-type histidine triad protein, partial [Streptococcus orisratti]|uniref:pneumococcal-type histidine triad protein n=1 Tax=Streptococcus orisratti TaxID=114652 RepID=UPI002A91DCEF